MGVSKVTRCNRCDGPFTRSRRRKETVAKQAGYCLHCFNAVKFNTALS